MLTDQWFVAMNQVGQGDATGKSIAQKAIDAVQSGEVSFVPENWVNTYNQWMNNIQDWCISRQLWWGHQIPAWYDEDGKVYVARNEAGAQAQSDKVSPGKTLKRDEDVLDTWYSSALVPFSTMGWGNNETSTKNAAGERAGLGRSDFASAASMSKAEPGRPPPRSPAELPPTPTPTTAQATTTSTFPAAYWSPATTSSFSGSPG
jgi:valyl-tRNA synthetase